MSNKEDLRDAPSDPLPQDILNKIAEYLKDAPEKLLTVLTFLADYDKDITKRYIQLLNTVLNVTKAFNALVDKIVEMTEKLKNDPNFLRIMADIWNNFLMPKEERNDGDLPDNQYKKSIVPCLVAWLSRIDETIWEKVGSFALRALSKEVNPTLRHSTESIAIKISVGLAGVFLAAHGIYTMRRWWKGEISGERCAKIIMDSFLTAAGGVGGGMAGAALGNCISPGIGGIIGGIAGGVVGVVAAKKLSEWLTQKIFGLPNNEALENAYIFLELKYGASNDDINNNYQRLAMKYHPDRGGKWEDWNKLQVSMTTIKISQDEF